MDNKTDIELEASPYNDDLMIHKGIFLSEPVRNVKNEDTTSDNEFKMGRKTNIKIEHNDLEVNLQNEGQSLSTNFERKIKDDETESIYDFEMDSKICIKEESVVSDAELQNGYLECTSLGTKIKHDTITDNDFRMDSKLQSGMQEFVSDVPSQKDKKCFTLDLVKKIKKEAITCFSRDVECTIHPEIQSHLKALPLSDISQANENEEGGPSKEQMAEDVPLSESPRLNAESRICSCLRSTFTEVSLKAHSGSKSFHSDHGNVEPCSSNSYWEKNVQENECNQSMCDICGTKFSPKSALHQLFHEAKKPLEDMVYEQQLFTTGQDKYNKCETCDLSFTQRKKVKIYKSIHESIEPHKSNNGNTSFTHTQNSKHKFTHEGNKPHKCDVCGSDFSQLGHLKVHKLIHEGSKPHKCAVCGRSFTQLAHLNKHKLIHEGKKPHKCDVCGRSFTDSGTLKRHKWIHEGSKPHKCDVCDKSFTTLGNLKAHKLNHEGKKPHTCDVCDKSFTQLQNLKNHKLIHEGKKPHRCNVCDKSFTRLQSLKIHKLIHEGKKPHKCDVCDKSFIILGNLKAHKLIHEGKNHTSVMFVIRALLSWET